MGLMPSGKFVLHDGNPIYPNTFQDILWQQYDECLDFIKQERKRSRLIWIENGDVCEGIHHQTTQIVSSRVDEHEKMAQEILDYTFKKLKFGGDDLAYMVCGTEAHASSGNQSENRVAKDIDGFVPQSYGDSEDDHRYVWNKLLIKINGVSFDIAHHGSSVGRRAWTTENGMYNRAKSFYFDLLNTNQEAINAGRLENLRELPRYWIRSHLHQYVQATYDGKCGSITGIVTPSFQMKTGFGIKVAGDRLSDIGLVVFIIEEDGTVSCKPVMASYKQDRVIEV